MTTSKTRAEFEAFMRSRNACVRLHRQRAELGGFYRTTTVQRAWEQWQAARKAALEEAAKVCEDMDEEDRPSDYAYAIRSLADRSPT